MTWWHHTPEGETFSPGLNWCRIRNGQRYHCLFWPCRGWELLVRLVFGGPLVVHVGGYIRRPSYYDADYCSTVMRVCWRWGWTWHKSRRS